MLRLSWLISMGLSLLSMILAIRFFTVSPNETTATEGMVFFGIALISPFILLSLFITYRFFFIISKQTINEVYRIGLLLLGVLFCSLMWNYASDFHSELLQQLGGNRDNKLSVIYNLPFINAYTLPAFLNLYSFLFMHSIVAIFAAIAGIFSKKSSVLNDKELYHD